MEEAERNYTFFRFEDLRVYHKALDYAEWVHSIGTLFPENEMQNLTVKFTTAAQAITLYLDEGSTRNKPQFVYYLKLAKNSIYHCVIYTALALKLNYISEMASNESRGQLMELTKMIGALIGSLQRSANYEDS